jgi:RND family efflux transporter MFP subunit
VFVSIDGRAAGALLLADELRPEAPRAIRALRAARVARIVMVTGDRADSAETIGAALDLDAVLADRAPADKVEAVELEQRLHPTVMVGDGINDAPALAAADVGIAMGARGASASSEAADVVILVDQIDRVSDAVVIARRTRAIALQSIVAGMALSGVAMGAAAFGWLTPVAGALTQEAIDVAVILNALRALTPGGTRRPASMAATDALGLRQDHEKLNASLDRIRQIADALDNADANAAVSYLAEANRIVAEDIVAHERADESSVYPQLSSMLSDSSGLFAMSRAHREILHMGRLLGRLSDGLGPGDADRYLIRDGQRIIESIESLVRIHNAQEQDIYENAGAELIAKKRWLGAGESNSAKSHSATRTGWAARAAAAALAILVLGGGWFVWSVRRDAPAHDASPGPQRRMATAIGVIQPIEAVAIRSQASGEIQSIGCESGADIKVGQLCAKIDPRPFKASIDRATIALAAAETRRVTTSSALASAKSAFEQSEKKAKRKAISRRSLEVKRKVYEQALTQANEAVALMAQRQDELRAAEISLARTDIVSPVDGTVVARNLEAGQRVSADSGTALFLIATDLAFIEVRSRLTGKGLAETKQGDKAVFTVEAFPDRSYSGEVMRIGEIVLDSQTPGSGEVNAGDNLSIRAPNPDRSLKPGMAATIKINLEGKAVGK